MNFSPDILSCMFTDALPSFVPETAMLARIRGLKQQLLLNTIHASYRDVVYLADLLQSAEVSMPSAFLCMTFNTFSQRRSWMVSDYSNGDSKHLICVCREKRVPQKLKSKALTAIRQQVVEADQLGFSMHGMAHNLNQNIKGEIPL